MCADGRSILVKRRELVHVLAGVGADPARYLQDSAELLRQLLGAEFGLLYRTATRGDGGLELDLCYRSGITSAQMDIVVGLLNAGGPFLAYDPNTPEEGQRNRVVSLYNTPAIDRAKLERVDSYYRKHQTSVFGQHRILVCDGPSLLAWVGVRREAALSTSEHRVLTSLIPHFVQALRLERDWRDKAVLNSGLTGIFDKLDGAWFMTTPSGRILFANAEAQVVLDKDGAGTRAQVKEAIARRNVAPGVDVDVSELGGNGLPNGFLVRLRGQKRIEPQLKLAAQVWKLTRKQVEVLQGLVAGELDKVIADQLGCAERTVQHHAARIRLASGAQTRTELVTRFWKLR